MVCQKRNLFTNPILYICDKNKEDLVLNLSVDIYSIISEKPNLRNIFLFIKCNIT